MSPPSVERLSDADLARCVSTAGGELGERAEEELLKRLSRRVRCYGRRHLRGEDAAAELVQRVLVITLEKLRAGQVREPERIGSFVLGVARMTAHDLRRRQRREAPLDSETGWEPDAALEPAADALAPEHLTRCLEALGDRERDVVVATYFGEQPSDQIAVALGVSTENVRQIRRRALLRLRRCMDPQSEEAA